MSSYEKFWSWFISNSGKYVDLDVSNREELLDKFLEELHRVSDGLFFEIGGYPGEVHELVITAEGNLEEFSNVERLVSASPDIENWKIIAFKQPMGFDFVTEYEGSKVSPSDSWFLPLVSSFGF